MLVCVFLCAFARETAGAARTRLSLRPLFSRAEVEIKARARGVAGTRIHVLQELASRHCEPQGRANARPMTGSAKQSIAPRKERMDYFAALAMTWTSRCHPSRHRPRRRAIQYSRDFSDRTDRLRRTGCPAFAGHDSSVWGGSVNVIARSEATKQSIRSLRGEMDCFAEPVIGRAFARPGGSQ
jgi:hypothetical protein